VFFRNVILIAFVKLAFEEIGAKNGKEKVA